MTTREDLTRLFRYRFLQPQIYQGDVAEIHAYGESFFLPLNEYQAKDYPKKHEVFIFSDRYLSRLSAEGFLDCTQWEMHDSEQDAIDCLADMADNDDDMPQEPTLDTCSCTQCEGTDSP